MRAELAAAKTLLLSVDYPVHIACAACLRDDRARVGYGACRRAPDEREPKYHADNGETSAHRSPALTDLLRRC